jgi:hypothetical protein
VTSASSTPAPPSDVDPFDLPEWLGGQVTWTPDCGIRTGHLVPGVLSEGEHALPCDLLAVDEAYPRPVADDDTRTRSHQAWRHGEVLLVTYDGRLTLTVPGREFTADHVLDALGRLARAVGASADDYAALLRLGRDRAK